MAEHPPDVLHHAALDARMLKAVRGIKLLGMVSWPMEVQQLFLAHWARGGTALPLVGYPKHDFSETRRELDAIIAEADTSHPLGHYVCDSARSWGIAAELLEVLGTKTVTTHSQRLFGHPDEPLPGNGPTTREAARHFIDIANELDRELLAPSEQVAISATALKHRKLRLCRMLFAGKMTLADVQRFEPLFDSGVILPPRWLPQWVSRANGLAGMLAFSLFANRIRLDSVDADDLVLGLA